MPGPDAPQAGGRPAAGTMTRRAGALVTLPVIPALVYPGRARPESRATAIAAARLHTPLTESGVGGTMIRLSDLACVRSQAGLVAKHRRRADRRRFARRVAR